MGVLVSDFVCRFSPEVELEREAPLLDELERDELDELDVLLFDEPTDM
ncbi:hypothetical protein [Stigmatella erecta]|nr:hypothetical protein [Stigmatella erecta]